MKKSLYLLVISILALGSILGVANAQIPDQQPLTEEAITYYVANIEVNKDNSIYITETISYHTGLEARHGIFRDIYPFSSDGRKMTIKDISVTDEIGNPYQYKISDVGKNVRIKIGDPNTTFKGQKVYIIKYHADRAVAQLDDIDEIYWNVTGNEWDMPIHYAEAWVTLPAEATVTQFACYFGLKGSTRPYVSTQEEGGIYHFTTPSLLNPREGLSLAAGFSKGVVTPYTASDTASDFFTLYWRWMIATLFPILTFILSLLHWYKKGRDDKGTGVIVPQYDVPNDLTPMEVGGIAEERVDVTQISAEIIYLATKGYIKIRQLDKNSTGFTKAIDYEITKLKNFSDLPNNFDKKILSGLFEYDSEVVKLSDLKNVYYKTASEVVSSVLDALLNKKYYKNLGKMKTGRGRIVFILFMSVWVSIFSGGIIGGVILGGKPFPLIVGIFFSIIIYGIISHFSPSKTETGIVAKEYILGLKDYLQIAEKDRLQFHNAPEKKPEVFEKLLPYAMVLGVANIWAKEFEGIYTTPPTWYSGPTDSSFNAVTFGQIMSNFTSHTSSSIGYSSTSSGSGGGGSSGGGGGGGGGGSW